jgi:GT2 family glycosyltransferase
MDSPEMKISTIAVLLTCHNRKEKTLGCLKTLFESKQACPINFEMDVYLTDDGSTDGTSSEIEKQFPSVTIFAGNGSLFWNGGMRNSWKEALRKKDYDGFLLLNDDIIMDKKCFDDLFKTHELSIDKYGTGSIYIGSLRDKDTLEHSYGGRLLLNKWTFSTKNVLPDGSIKECHLGNGNFMFVHRKVVETIGIFSKKYIHAKADYDYSLRAFENNLPILVCPNYCGFCSDDHKLQDLKKMNFKERVNYLKSPKGIELSGYMYFMWKYFPLRAPFVFCALWLKTLIPGISGVIDKLMKRQ